MLNQIPVTKGQLRMNSETGETAGQPADTNYRNSDVRFGTHCPGIVELTFKDRKHFIALTGVIVNLSVTGCLFSNDKMPWANLGTENPLEKLLQVIDESCRIYIPWINTHSTGRISRIGSFIIGVEFDEALKQSLVKSVASLEPNQTRRFKPKVSAKYNRILPIASKLPVTPAASAD